MNQFLTIRNACAKTGLSMHYIRTGCREKKIPCIKSGNKYYVDMQAFSEQLHQESKEASAALK